MANIAKVQLTDTINYQRNRINDIIDNVNNTSGSSVIIVETERDLPSAQAAQSNAFIVKRHSVLNGAVLACLIDGVYRFTPLKSDAMNANTFIYVTATKLGDGVSANKCVYLDENGIWQLANSTDDKKYATGIVGTNAGFIILAGTYYNNGLNLSIGQTYYYNDTGDLQLTPTNGIAGTAIDSDTISVHFQVPIEIQPDWNEEDETAPDYIKNKPTIVSKEAAGLAPQLPDETTVSKFLRQDGTWSVPNYPEPGLSKSGDAMTGLLPDKLAAQVRNIQILTTEQSTGVDGMLYAVIEEY